MEAGGRSGVRVIAKRDFMRNIAKYLVEGEYMIVGRYGREFVITIKDYKLLTEADKVNEANRIR